MTVLQVKYTIQSHIHHHPTSIIKESKKEFSAFFLLTSSFVFDCVLRRVFGTIFKATLDLPKMSALYIVTSLIVKQEMVKHL